MPKYELMYIIGSHVADDEAAKVVDEVKKYLESAQAVIQKHEDLGKKKFAYPIKHTKLGQYIVVSFELLSDKVNEFEHKIRTNPAIIRHLILNMEEAVVRLEKDRVEQAKLKTVRPMEEAKPAAMRPKPKAADGKKIQIDLDAEIEKALESEDLK
jgi:small subunit ribosomal protein S6